MTTRRILAGQDKAYNFTGLNPAMLSAPQSVNARTSSQFDSSCARKGVCAICGHKGRIELDHMFRRSNDPDYVIPLGVRCRCHRIVTIMDTISGVDPSEPYAPFVFMLHRIRLGCARNGLAEIGDMFRAMEHTILGVNDARLMRPRKGRSRTNYSASSESNQLAFMVNMIMWTIKAADLSRSRLDYLQTEQGQAEYEPYIAMLGEIAANPLAFATRLETSSIESRTDDAVRKIKRNQLDPSAIKDLYSLVNRPLAAREVIK